jgi:hypothetical protein
MCHARRHLGVGNVQAVAVWIERVGIRDVAVIECPGVRSCPASGWCRSAVCVRRERGDDGGRREGMMV